MKIRKLLPCFLGLAVLVGAAACIALRSSAGNEKETCADYNTVMYADFFDYSQNNQNLTEEEKEAISRQHILDTIDETLAQIDWTGQEEKREDYRQQLLLQLLPEE